MSVDECSVHTILQKGTMKCEMVLNRHGAQHNAWHKDYMEGWKHYESTETEVKRGLCLIVI